jgi:hypothetical protein
VDEAKVKACRKSIKKEQEKLEIELQRFDDIHKDELTDLNNKKKIKSIQEKNEIIMRK